MKNLLFLSLICLVCTTTNAATYYFSSSTGDDNRTSRQAQDPATPWKSLAKLNAWLPDRAPNDFALLKRGDVFYGNIIITGAGIASAPITIGAYGTGNDPVINGFTTVTGWTYLSDGIYESKELLTGTSVNMVTIDGKEYAMGRLPNADAPNAGYKIYKKHTANSITDNDTTYDAGWVGAEVVIRTTHASLDRGNISAVNSGQITISSGSLKSFQYPITQEGYGYFLQNSTKTLDQFGEWYYNPSTHKLRVYFGKKNPGSYNVLASAIDTLIEPGSSNITIRDLFLTGANSYGVCNNWKGVSNQKYINCTFAFNGIDGIFLIGKTNVTIDSCTFNYNNSNSISIGYQNVNCIVSNCIITHSGTLQGMLKVDGVERCGYGIFSSSQPGVTGLTAINNQIINTGYIGIFFAGDNNLIQNNFIDSACLILDDGAGIYTGNYTPAGKTPVVNTNNKVLNNIVDHCIGAPLGADGVHNMAHCYYFDDWANHITFIGNTGANAGFSGLFIHNTNNYTVLDNIFYNNGSAQIYWQDDKSGHNVFNGIVKHNQLIATKASQMLLYFQSQGNNFNDFADIDSNYYASPFNENIAYTNWFKNAEHTYTFAKWKSAFKKDLDTKELPFPVTDVADINFKYNKTASPQTIKFNDLIYAGLDSVSYKDEVTIPPFRSVLLLKRKK